MTVKELISELESLSPDLIVVVRGYENGFNDVVAVKSRKVLDTAKAEWWDGRYQETDEAAGSIKAVELFGDNFIAMP